MAERMPEKLGRRPRRGNRPHGWFAAAPGVVIRGPVDPSEEAAARARRVGDTRPQAVHPTTRGATPPLSVGRKPLPGYEPSGETEDGVPKPVAVGHAVT